LVRTWSAPPSPSCLFHGWPSTIDLELFFLRHALSLWFARANGGTRLGNVLSSPCRVPFWEASRRVISHYLDVDSIGGRVSSLGCCTAWRGGSMIKTLRLHRDGLDSSFGRGRVVAFSPPGSIAPRSHRWLRQSYCALTTDYLYPPRVSRTAMSNRALIRLSRDGVFQSASNPVTKGDSDMG